ncbi:MAG: hypothetical protein QNJ31_09235 [Candidatus Caenarcaniphilales bacterium]|nr:hypothetical protein [Candidatus Caenarcaniphilales bacterium]
MFDGCHFGQEFVVLLFRSDKKNLYWTYEESEKILYYEESLRGLSKKYVFQSFTIDGRKGVIQLLENLFPDIPIQLCQFHQVKTIIKYTTKRPKTECGKDLKRLALTLKSSSKGEFKEKFKALQEKYHVFLKERNENGEFKHRSLRAAFRSLKTNFSYLFTCQDFPHLEIPNTTNSCDGYFSHLKKLVRVHQGITFQRKIQMINHVLAS